MLTTGLHDGVNDVATLHSEVVGHLHRLCDLSVVTSGGVAGNQKENSKERKQKPFHDVRKNIICECVLKQARTTTQIRRQCVVALVAVVKTYWNDGGCENYPPPLFF